MMKIMFSEIIYIFHKIKMKIQYLAIKSIQFKYKHLLIYAYAHIIFSPLYAYSKNSPFTANPETQLFIKFKVIEDIHHRSTYTTACL